MVALTIERVNCARWATVCGCCTPRSCARLSVNKTDATDAHAIWLAVQQPGVKFVGIKTTAQQATLTLHRQREALMTMRIMQINALRGLLYEFGATIAKGKNALLKDIKTTLTR